MEELFPVHLQHRTGGAEDGAAAFTLREVIVRDDFDERNGTGAVPLLADSIVYSLADDSHSFIRVLRAASRVFRLLRFLPDNAERDAAFTEQGSGEGFFFPQNSEEQVPGVDERAYAFFGLFGRKSENVFGRRAKREIDGRGNRFDTSRFGG